VPAGRHSLVRQTDQERFANEGADTGQAPRIRLALLSLASPLAVPQPSFIDHRQCRLKCHPHTHTRRREPLARAMPAFESAGSRVCRGAPLARAAGERERAHPCTTAVQAPPCSSQLLQAGLCETLHCGDASETAGAQIVPGRGRRASSRRTCRPHRRRGLRGVHVSRPFRRRCEQGGAALQHRTGGTPILHTSNKIAPIRPFCEG
jgi:hypothetical protein